MDSPTAWNVNDKSDYLNVNSDGDCIEGSQDIAATIRANYPIPSQCKLFYFEVEIIDKRENGYVEFIFFLYHS